MISPRSQTKVVKTKKTHPQSDNSSTWNKHKKTTDMAAVNEKLTASVVSTVRSLDQMVRAEKHPSHDNTNASHSDVKTKHVRIDAEHTLIGANRIIEESIAEEPEINNNEVTKPPSGASVTVSPGQTGDKSPKVNSLAVPRAGNQKPLSTSTPKSPLRDNYTTANGDIENHQSEKHVKISDSFDTLDGKPSTPFEKRSISRNSKYSAASKHSTNSAGQFSCHTNIDRPVSSRADTFKGAADVIGGYLGENPFELRRKNLLRDEEEKLYDLQDKKDDFLDDMDRYISHFNARNREPSVVASLFQLPDSVLEDIQKAKAEARSKNRLKRMQRKMHRNSQSEEERVKRVSESSKDVNKCRYLRVPSEKIDLSGIVTLASEQMKLFKNLRPLDNDTENDDD